MHELSVDLHKVPWSCRGSYLSLCTLAGPGGGQCPHTDLYLSTHQIPIGRPMFALRPSVEELPPPQGFLTTDSPTTFGASADTLHWKLHDRTVAEAVFQDARILRVRGTIPLNLDTDASVLGGGYSSYIAPVQSRHKLPSMLEFTTFGYQGMYLVALKGEFTCVNILTADDGNRRITIKSSEGGDWELAIIERETSLVSDEGSERFETLPDVVAALSTVCFEDVKSHAHARFSEYAKALLPWTSNASSTETYAAFAMWTSTVRPMGLLKREGVLMSKLWMDKIWSWDNCFNAVALASLGLRPALDNILIPYDFQTPQGRLPDSVTQCEILYDFAKPPIYGWALFKIQEVAKIDRRSLEPLYEKVSRFTNFWLVNRTSSHSELCHYIHGNDSGWDNATCFDEDPVIVSPDLAAFLIIQADWLAVTAANLRRGNESEQWVSTRDRLAHDLVDELWTDDGFVVKSARTGKLIKSSSLLTLIPLVAAPYLPKPIVTRMVGLLDQFTTQHGLATEALDSPLYEPDGYWRGPIWAPVTALIESGLRKSGHLATADTIRARFMAMCDVSGFAENYDAQKGTGNRDSCYTWAASVYLMFAREAIF
ncbi:Six-hairpin glycosidase-like protein [Kockovaella imperatae]|uniref:Six-hairpin glycosidase-like protein n=1 Tax=Kockovaella imperatae TaxID=4999 RepID=A0A1Y1UG12_9TREE|nr:Six-hairpin glycosidase-like protein [Kockovaella imperatae]ORX36962.1 Six-hairpin glycosidase-like protein [Kockovaella imperatae]